jgi:hypothetical protein
VDLKGFELPSGTPLRMIIDHADQNTMAAEAVVTVSDGYTVEVPLEAHTLPTRMSRNISPNSTRILRGFDTIASQRMKTVSATT